MKIPYSFAKRYYLRAEYITEDGVVILHKTSLPPNILAEVRRYLNH